jgi:hypothetical protein
MYFIGRQLGGAGAILAETTQNMAFVALGSQTFSQVSEVLRATMVGKLWNPPESSFNSIQISEMSY